MVLSAPSLVVLLGSLTASGQGLGTEKTALETERELAEIIALLEREQTPSQRWWWGWLGTYTGLTVGQGIIAGASQNPDVRIAYALGATGSLLGVANMLINPTPGRRGADLLPAMPTTTDAQRSEALRAAEAVLERNARSQASQFGFFAHAGGFVVSAATAGVLWFHFDLKQDAALNLIGGVLITEAQVFTAPRRVHSAWTARQGGPVVALRLQLSTEPRGMVLIADF